MLSNPESLISQQLRGYPSTALETGSQVCQISQLLLSLSNKFYSHLIDKWNTLRPCFSNHGPVFTYGFDPPVTDLPVQNIMHADDFDVIWAYEI